MENFKHAAIKKACLQNKHIQTSANILLAHLDWSVTWKGPWGTSFRKPCAKLASEA